VGEVAVASHPAVASRSATSLPALEASGLRGIGLASLLIELRAFCRTLKKAVHLRESAGKSAR
jgi:hypothetical protein